MYILLPLYIDNLLYHKNNNKSKKIIILIAFSKLFLEERYYILTFIVFR